MSSTATKVSEYMSKFLGLKQDKDFRVADGPGNRVCVQMNTGHNLGSYRKGLEQQLVNSDHTLQLTSTQLHVREKKIA